MDTVLLAHLVCTAFLTGLIWVVQLVHYPLFDHADAARFVNFESSHSQRITWIVGPMMLAEGFTGLWILVDAYGGGGVLAEPAALVNVGLLALVWASTAFLQVPAHTTLAAGFDADAHRRLVRSNWIRTATWSVRTVGLFLLVAL